MSLQPEYCNVTKLFVERLFRIPDYQRAYSWGTKQRKDLFDDITRLSACKNTADHFMASVVCLKREPIELETSTYTLYDIVDGQQRITSLIILLKVLSEELKKSKDASLKARGQEIEGMLIKDDGRLVLLQGNHDSSLMFQSFLKSYKKPSPDHIKTQAEKNICNAINETEKFVTAWGKLSELLKIVLSRLCFVYYAIEDEGAVYSTFEVLNSRGLTVDWLDKTKSSIMGIIYEKHHSEVSRELFSECNKIWSDIYQTIGTNNISGDEILRFSATLKTDGEISKMLSAEEALFFFKTYCMENPDRILDAQLFIRDIAVKLKALYENTRLNAVTDIIHARLLYIAIQSSDHIAPKDKTVLLNLWERVTFRIFGIAKKDSRTMNGKYIQIARKIFNNIDLSIAEISEDLKNIGNDFNIQKVFESLLSEKDCYNGWSHELRYFFFRYEEYLAKKSGADLDASEWAQIWASHPETSIEHIFPQNPDASWIGKMGKGNGVIANNVHRLGNLVLLPAKKNNDASNGAFQEKKKIYRKSNILILKEIFTKHNWTIDQIKEREKSLMDFAVETWG